MEWFRIRPTPTVKSWTWSEKEDDCLSLKHVQVRKDFHLKLSKHLPLTFELSDEVFKLWYLCWSMEPKDRPSFAEILICLNEIKGEESVLANSFTQEFDHAYHLTTADQGMPYHIQ